MQRAILFSLAMSIPLSVSLADSPSLLEKLDQDSDETVSQQEAAQSPLVDHLFVRLDTDRNNAIDVAECSMLSTLPTSGPMGQPLPALSYIPPIKW
jgi:hypothetical protein